MKTFAVACVCLGALAGRAVEGVTATPKGPSPRTWTDNTGRHSVVAEFVEFKDGRVYLKKDDGQVISLPLERLSQTDREFVKGLRAPGEAREDGARMTVACPGLVHLAVSPDGDAFATLAHLAGKNTSEIKLWSARTGRLRVTLKDPAPGWIQFLAFTGDGKHVAAPGKALKDPVEGLYRHHLQLWDAKTGRPRPPADAMAGIAGYVQDAKTGRTQLARPADIWLYDSRSGQIRPAPVPPPVFSPDPKAMLTAFWGEREPSSVLSPDGKTVAQASREATVVLGPVGEGGPRRVLKFAGMSPFVAFTPDARTLVTAGRAMSIETWDVNTGEKRATFQTDWDAMRLVPAWPTISRIPLLRISPDGKTLASAGGKGHPDAVVVRLWDLATGRQRGGADLKFQVQCLAFSPDSRILAVGGLHWAEPLRLLDVETGKQLAGLKGHDALVIAVFFLPDGKTLVSAGNDEAIRWWDVPPR